MWNNVFDTKDCRLTIKSPIHIGSVEQRLTPFEYVHANNHVYFLSDERLGQFLAKKNLIDAYVRAVSREGHRFRLAGFFRERGVKVGLEDLIAISGSRSSRIVGGASKLQDLRPFTRDGMGEVYIPGTSLKGVFRTAVLFNALSALKSKDPSGFHRLIEESILQDISRKVNKKIMFKWGAEEWLQGFTLNNKHGSPNTDWLRMLHVTDAYPVRGAETTILPVSILKKENGDWKFKVEGAGVNTVIWAECVPEGTVFEFQVSWDKKLLENFKKQNTDTVLPEDLKEVLGSVENWSGAVKAFEESFLAGHHLRRWYNGSRANFRIGFGSGMTSTTIAPLLTDELREKIRNYAGFDRGDAEAPKSRRIWLNDSQPIPLGWAMLETTPVDPKSKTYFHPGPIKQRPATRPETPEVDSVETAKPVQRPQTLRFTWENATISWSPGNKTLLATCGGRKADLQIGDDRSLIPEGFHKMLFEKRKGVSSDIVVEKVGNAFKIVKLGKE